MGLGIAVTSLSGCVADGPGYVESRVINEGRVGGPVYATAPVYREAPAYRDGPIGRTVIVDSYDPYARGGYRQPRYGARYGDRSYAPPRERYDRRDGYEARFDRRRYCASVRYEDPRCD
ncbi:hypothetical protein ASG43_07995 [Aureimonas sp. Leaf454]|nr:hypothetical protein ASG43_07995 [Aureimonas sp. Leaf454]